MTRSACSAWKNSRRPCARSSTRGRTVEELTLAVFAELAIKRTRRADDLIAEAIRVARAREQRAELTGSRWQASTFEVRN